MQFIGFSQFSLALGADVVLGDPPSWPHLVRFMGLAIAKLEDLFRAVVKTPAGLRLAGAVMAVIVTGGFYLAAWLLILLGQWIWPALGFLIGLFLSFQCLASGQLWREAKRVAKTLDEGDLPAARSQLAMIVGRDTDSLTAGGVRRALVETVAENLNDGVIAPMLYLVLLGPAGAVAYKAINTMDSMVGYRNERYLYLGMIPARLDDLAGWLPARLTALLMLAASPLLGLDPKGGWRALKQDRGAHKSPNSGWPEATAAGALGIRLGGPNQYFGRTVEKPWINQEGGPASAGDVKACLRLMALTTALAWLLGSLWLLFV